MTIEAAPGSGWCQLTLPLEFHKTIGYSLSYPERWKVQLVGAERMNLRFDTNVNPERKQAVFLQVTLGERLTLEQLDQAVYGYEMSGPEPLIEKDEVVKSRKTQTVGDKQVLIVNTQQGENTIRRYFLVCKESSYMYGNSVYMYEVKLLSTDMEKVFVSQLFSEVEEIIKSMKYLSKTH